MSPRLALMASRATREESLHLALAAAAAVVGLVVGLVALRGTTPLAGAGSIGQVAALSVFGCGAATAALVLATITPRSLPWFGGSHWARRTLDIVGLSLVYGILGLLLTSALFGVFAQAFQGVALDRSRARSGSSPRAPPGPTPSPPRRRPSPAAGWRPCSPCSSPRECSRAP